MFLISLCLLLILVILIYVFLIWNFDHWRKLGVTSPKPLPLLGNVPSLFTQKQHIAEDFGDVYRKYKHTDNYVGVFLMRIPQLLILEPALVHDIFVNAFNHFHENDLAKMVDRKRDPLIANNPFILTGSEWREQRATITGGLTGTRIKVAYATMQEVCKNFCTFIAEEAEQCGAAGVNGKDLALRFTCENLADCVLGIKAKSFTPTPIPIAENVRAFGEENTYFMIFQFVTGLYPKLLNFYKAKFVTDKCEKFFYTLMTQAFEMRSKQPLDRQDFLNYLLSLRDKQQLCNMELASHAMTFLIDGLETTATTIAHCLMLLARDQQAQKRLRQEILANCDEHGELSFENLNEMDYLNACLHETIRIFTPGHIFSKTCTQPYELTNKNGSKLQLQVGDVIIIPALAIHHDETFFPEPKTFRPERFLKENGGVKHYRDAGLFLGFGDGPRMCLGMRFALVQTKAAVAAVIQHFNVTVNAKTKPTNCLDPKQFLSLQDGGVWLNFQRISGTNCDKVA